MAANGYHYALPTEEPGNYVLELRDDQNRTLSKLRFSVVGRAAMTGALEKNAELEIKLNAKEYRAGDEIELSVTAPYSGYGLITIEREKIYAYSWFQTNTASSIQHIRLPENFEGSGYVNVAFVRALDSKEIFVSPLSYGVVPFTANIEKRRLKIDLQAAAKGEAGRTVAHRLQDRSAQQDRHLRGRSGNSASYRITKRRIHSPISFANALSAWRRRRSSI